MCFCISLLSVLPLNLFISFTCLWERNIEVRADCMENTARVWSRKNEVGTGHRDEILNNYPHFFFQMRREAWKDAFWISTVFLMSYYDQQELLNKGMVSMANIWMPSQLRHPSKLFFHVPHLRFRKLQMSLHSQYLRPLRLSTDWSPSVLESFSATHTLSCDSSSSLEPISSCPSV